MKKILLSLVLLPLFAFAPDSKTIDLKDFGLNATIQNNTTFSEEPEVSGKNEGKYFEIKIRFNGDAKLEIEKIPKPMTAAKLMGQFRKMLTEKTKGVVIKKISGGTNDIMISRTRDGVTIYKGFFATSQKGKEIMVMTNDADDQATCKQLLDMAKTLKFY